MEKALSGLFVAFLSVCFNPTCQSRIQFLANSAPLRYRRTVMSMTYTCHNFPSLTTARPAAWVGGNPGTGALDVLARRRTR